MRKATLLFSILLAFRAQAQNECRLHLDEAHIDLHGFLRAFYSCQALGRSFVMDNQVQRPIPSYANFSYGRANYASILKEMLNPLGLKLVQGKFMDAVILAPPKEPGEGIAPVPPPAPLAGAAGNGGGASRADSAAVEGMPEACEVLPDADTAKAPRRMRAKASGLLKSSARRLGVSWSEFFAETDRGSLNNPKLSMKYNEIWKASARASDSLGSLDFARVIDFTAGDTAKVVFGSETRRPESTLNYENGTSITEYSSIFDGLTVEVRDDRWFFLWRGSGSVLEVPGSVGSCASGSSKIVFEARAGVPFLSGIPVMGYLFSYESKWSDELLVSVCLEALEL
jgi:hypothetical protein